MIKLYTATKSDVQDPSLKEPLWEVLDPEGKAWAWGKQDFCEKLARNLNEGVVVLPN